MSQGWDYGWKGAIAGGIAGGIFGGWDASKHDRNFWTGAPKQYGMMKLYPDRYAFNGTNKDLRMPEQWKTDIVDGKYLSVNQSTSEVTFTVPDGFERLSVITDYGNVGSGSNSFTIDFNTLFGELPSKVGLTVMRYQSSNGHSLGNLFYSRGITPIYKWF